MRIKIGIVDDKSSNRNILKDKLLRGGQFTIALMAEDGKDFLEKMQGLDLDEQPDVVLMDLEMPVMDGVEAIATGSFLYPAVKFVVLTIFDDEDKIFRAIKAGAYGYLLKDESSENISSMLLQMQESGAGPISPGIAFKILQLVQNNNLVMAAAREQEKKQLFNLTAREQEILKLLVEGLLYKEIGAKLDISPHTAKKHVINIYNKLHVNTRAQVINIAHGKKWFD
jgi:DNA-binding NarL/FixJ family response regulator